MFARRLFAACSNRAYNSHAVPSSFPFNVRRSFIRGSLRSTVSKLSQGVSYRRMFSSPSIVSKQSIESTSSSASMGMFAGMKAPRFVGYWMLSTSALVSGIVILGGLTRLTESGLSMVTWSLTGSPPPRSEEEWHLEFERYKKFPEYLVLNRGMTVDEFKQIFWYEYLHRMLGRVIGLFVILPSIYIFSSRKLRSQCSPAIKKRIGVMCGLVCWQGALGWYMVKSGLDHSLVEDKKVPRVSQYRLAAHLGSAFVIYLTALTTGLSVLAHNNALLKSAKSLSASTLKSSPSSALSGNFLLKFRRYSLGITGMIFVTAMSGAFVAGLDAGLIYNTFPKMADRWIPSDLLAFQPLWTNIFENPTTVQFNHRLLAMSTYAAVGALWIYSRRLKGIQGMHGVVKATNLLFAVANLQVGLGVMTLLWLVPVPLASAHQSGSLALLTSAFWLQHVLKRLPK